MDIEQFMKDFQDYLAPRLDTYEQAIYLYVFRHTRLLGKNEGVIGFKSARRRMACGIGEKGKPMSEGTAYAKLQSLKEKRCIDIVASEYDGHRIQLKLPWEIPGLIPNEVEPAHIDLETIDFFTIEENRPLILSREKYRCFYCLCNLDSKNYVIEHVNSRPDGNNSYRNVVAACRQCNNRKGASDAEAFLRTLYRESLLGAAEFEDRISQLQRLRAGDIKPQMNAG